MLPAVTQTDEIYRLIAAESHLPAGAARQLHDDGFLVMRGPAISGGLEYLSHAYDHAVAMADSADVGVSISTRVTDFVNRGEAFDAVYVYPPLLAACCSILGGPFKLSGTRTRTLEPGASIEALHVDVKAGADGWPIVGFIMMVDEFDNENGATRFVPGSHLKLRDPGEAMSNLRDAHENEVLACGPAGSIIIFNGSVWHGHTANRSPRRRRSLQGHFVRRQARSSVDHAARMRPDVLGRISSVARYLLAIE